MSRNRRRLVTFAAMCAAIVLMAACGTDNGETAAEEDEERSFRIAVFEIVQLDIIDDMRNGFIQAMEEAGLREGEDVTYQQFNAQGEEVNCGTIADQLAQQDWDMTYVLGTGCVQAMYQNRPDFPVIFGGMTDPVGAGLADDFDSPKPNTTGSSDMVTPDTSIGFLLQMFPDIETIGTLGNPAEANTQSWMELLDDVVQERNLEVINVPVQTTADVQTAANSLIGRVDIIIAPPDNTVEPAIGAVIRVSVENDVPLLTAKAEHPEEGALIGMGVDYFQLGLLDGAKGAQILLDGVEPETLPVGTLEEPIVTINLDTAREIGVEVPDEILANENVTTVGG